jgi:Yip1 domain
MWYAPRATVRHLIDGRAGGALPLAALLGISQALDRAASRDAAASMSLPAILALSVAAGAVAGPAMLYVSSWLVRWTGSWLGGHASAAELRTAIAWGQVPTISAMPLWIPVLLVGGLEMFRAEPRFADPSESLVVLICGFAMAAAAIWGTVTAVLCVGEAHRFSAWRALGSLALAVAVVAVPLGAIGMVVALLSSR